jgi:hypothetical protein
MHVCSQGGKSVHAPRSQMSGLDFHTEPLFDCADDDSGDIAFIWATKFVGGRDTMEEFLACGVYLLAANVGFDRVAVGVTSILKLKMPLLKFVAARKDDDDDVKFFARNELDSEGIMGSYTRPEHDICIAGLRNGGHLNPVFELARVAYKPRPVPGSDASKKRKADATRKASVKHPKASGKKKGESVKASALRGKASLKRPSNEEVASARPVKLSKKTVSCPAAAATTMHIAIGASGPKGAAGASGSKGVASASGSTGTASAKKLPRLLGNAVFPPLALWWRQLRPNLKSHRLMVERLGTLHSSLCRCHSLKL